MARYRRILVATDFSVSARHAFVAAVTQARRDAAELFVVNVVEPLAVGLADMALDDHLAERMLASSAELLRVWTDEARQHGVSAVKCLQLTGPPWREIVDAARSEDADLVVVGTHGHAGLAHFLLGSVAERVVQHAPCNVLVARPPEAVS